MEGMQRLMHQGVFNLSNDGASSPTHFIVDACPIEKKQQLHSANSVCVHDRPLLWFPLMRLHAIDMHPVVLISNE